MGGHARLNWARLDLFASLVAGWLVGFGIHGSAAAASGWGDVPPVDVLLGAALCAWAGVVAWVVAPGRPRRFGALAGVLMFASFVVGNVLVVALWVDPAHVGQGGETWFSLLIESWFWVGVPLVVSAALGTLGWTVADALGRRRRAPVA